MKTPSLTLTTLTLDLALAHFFSLLDSRSPYTWRASAGRKAVACESHVPHPFFAPRLRESRVRPTDAPPKKKKSDGHLLSLLSSLLALFS